MVAANYHIVRFEASHLDYSQACELAQRVASQQTAGLAYIDLSGTPEATMGGLAKLILLRGELLKAGRDLRITGLQGRAKGLHEIYRLSEALPVA